MKCKLFFIVLSFLTYFVYGQSTHKITRELYSNIENVSPDSLIRVKIVLNNQFDYNKIDISKCNSKEERRQCVIKELQAFSSKHQANVISLLKKT